MLGKAVEVLDGRESEMVFKREVDEVERLLHDLDEVKGNSVDGENDDELADRMLLMLERVLDALKQAENTKETTEPDCEVVEKLGQSEDRYHVLARDLVMRPLCADFKEAVASWCIQVRSGTIFSVTLDPLEAMRPRRRRS